MQNYAAGLLAQVKDFKAEAEALQGYQEVLKFEVTELEELEDTFTEVELKDILWENFSAFQELTAEWRQAPFSQVCSCARRATMAASGSACSAARARTLEVL